MGRSRLGQLLRRYRRDAGFSQNALAEAIGVSASTINRLETGTHRTVQFATICQMADLLGFSLDEAALAAGLRAAPSPAIRPSTGNNPAPARKSVRG
jgi:transcriptional regulator with XRE-family HTH domain